MATAKSTEFGNNLENYYESYKGWDTVYLDSDIMHPNVYITIKNDVKIPAFVKPEQPVETIIEQIENAIEQPINDFENKFNSIPFNGIDLDGYVNNIIEEFPNYNNKDKSLLNGLLFNKTIYQDGLDYYNIQIDNDGEFIPEKIEINLNGYNVNLENGVFKNNTTEYRIIPVFDEKGNFISKYTLEETSDESEEVKSTELINVSAALEYIETNTGLLLSNEQTEVLKIYAENKNSSNYNDLIESIIKTTQNLDMIEDIKNIFNYKDDYLDFKSTLDNILDNKHECKQN